MPSVTQELKTFQENVPSSLEVDLGTVVGLEAAIRYVQAGRFISAVKLVESLNPSLTRQQAKAVVNAFGYSNEFKWPEEQSLPVRCL